MNVDKHQNIKSDLQPWIKKQETKQGEKYWELCFLSYSEILRVQTVLR